MTFMVQCVACNEDGPFDQAYSFGANVDDSGQMTGTPEQIGAELTRFLHSLAQADIEAMKYGTDRFYLSLTIEPV